MVFRYYFSLPPSLHNQRLEVQLNRFRSPSYQPWAKKDHTTMVGMRFYSPNMNQDGAESSAILHPRE